MTERSQAQLVLDVMFSVLSRVHARDNVPVDREECMSWARAQLVGCGVDVMPIGMSHAVIVNEVTDRPAATVRKKDGYGFPGVVVSTFTKVDGATRCVVECTAAGCEGMLHIFNPDQLEPT